MFEGLENVLAFNIKSLFPKIDYVISKKDKTFFKRDTQKINVPKLFFEKLVKSLVKTKNIFSDRFMIFCNSTKIF